MNKKLRIFFCAVACFSIGSTFGLGIFESENSGDNYFTFIFVALLILIFLAGLRMTLKSNSQSELRSVAFLAATAAIAIQGGIIVGLAFANAPDSALWVSDTYSSHLPLAKSVADALTGKDGLPAEKGFSDHVLFTHFYVGIFFALFGVKPWVSALAMLLLKCCTIGIIWQWTRKLFNERAAAISIMAYGLMPTVMFYTMTFYKEAVIQFFVAAIMLSLFEILQKRDYRFFLLITPTLYALMYERFYLFPPFLFVLFFTLFFQAQAPRRIKLAMLLMALILGGIFATTYNRYFPIEGLLKSLMAMRASLNSYSDINPAFNRDLFYPLAVLKITFTPYFTLSKFSLFSNLSYLLIWGSFFNQAIIALGLYGFWRAAKTNWRTHWYYGVPFVWFLMLYAYLAPYSGRQRDSFYPLIAVYSAIAISQIISKKLNAETTDGNIKGGY